MADTRVYLKQQEAVTLRFNVRDKSSGAPVDLTGANCTFVVKPSRWTPSPLISKSAVGSTTEMASGVVSCTLAQEDLNIPAGLYYGELYMDISVTNRRKSPDIILDVRPAVT